MSGSFGQALQKPPGLLVPCYAVYPVDTGIVEVPHEDQCLHMCALFQLSAERHIYFFLIRQSVADTHHNIANLGLPTNANPHIPSKFITCR